MKRTIGIFLCCIVLQLGATAWAAKSDYHDWNLEIVFDHLHEVMVVTVVHVKMV